MRTSGTTQSSLERVLFVLKDFFLLILEPMRCVALDRSFFSMSVAQIPLKSESDSSKMSSQQRRDLSLM